MRNIDERVLRIIAMNIVTARAAILRRMPLTPTFDIDESLHRLEDNGLIERVGSDIVCTLGGFDKIKIDIF